MRRKLMAIAPAIAALACGQTQIDNSKQIRNRAPALLATDFAGSDIGQQVNNAFASFPAGKCGTVAIPSGTFTFAATIYIPTGCTLEGAGRGNDHGPHATKLLYNGTGGTPAVVVGMKSDGTPQYYTTLRDLAVFTNAQECPNDGMLAWNAAAAGSNKWQCYDGATFTSPLPHLAGVMHGQIDPDQLLDGTHVTIERVDVNGGGQDGDINQQGGFHFGIWLNGCEECGVRDSYAFQCDDGFALGEATNGALLSQVSARINRRAGLQYRGANAVTCNACLFESNLWFGHQGADPTKYGAGIRISDAATGNGRGAIFRSTYFEANDVDVYSASPSGTGAGGTIDLQTVACDGKVRGKFSGSFIGCDLNDPTVFTARGNDIVFGGTVNGMPNTEADNNGNWPRLIFLQRSNGTLHKVMARSGSGTYVSIFQAPASGDDHLYVRNADGSSNASLDLEGTTAATAVGASDSPLLKFRSFKWTGASTAYEWYVRAAARTGGGPESTSGLHVLFGGSDPVVNSQFAFREGGAFRFSTLEARKTTPAAAVTGAAGTGAACAVDAGFGVSDVSGQMTLTTGTASWSTGAQCTVTLANAFGGWVTLTPANAAAAAAMNARQVYVDRGTNQFSVSFGAAATSQQTFQFNWHAIGNF